LGVRLQESHKAGGRPTPTDDSAEYNFRFGAEEKLAVGLAGVARVVLNALVAVETATVALAVGAKSQR